MYIIAGLGNPGREYARTRHNVGFEAVDALAGKYGIDVTTGKFKALIGKGLIEGQRVLLVKPLTYMNLSGESLREAADFFKVDVASELIVIHDDISLPPGQLRIRAKGSAGGHNGLKSIIAQLGTQEFLRIKVGVGEKPADGDLVNHVLGRFPKEERVLMDEVIARAASAAVCLMTEGLEKAMNEYNRKAEA